ncbi:1-acylglycerol-3-phosphate O-acyltransferase [Lachnospiraceae bacterium WCA-9-b2]|uniref:1-acyl-sn-glycerol-3-phosphate acyltransferase n=1 Tax=Sporofaciens musculi TaxID=2681861 RepID=A0A7X3MLI8_9FIRM|nr:lysophospholipid acyltransferase family protein [Sporofaciens musculi]MXP78653.1 1-acylglycerol-3-phosphate O-acyltransferase [Sporofaciens musculi]
MIRFILLVLFLFSFLLFGIPMLIIEWALSKCIKNFNKEASDYRSLRVVQWAFRGLLWITGVEVTVIGEENVPDEPVLFIANHRSYFDILLTYSRCKRLTGYVAKKEMLRYPILRDWMKRLYCLFLDRDNPKEGLKSILEAIDHVKRGISICIFPEGTRNDGEELSMLPFHSGSFKIAEKSGCAIVPISLNNTHTMFEQHIPRIEKTHVVIEYGKPIYPKELDKETRKRIAPYCQEIIQETINRNQALV